MRLLLIRHAETVWNAAGRVQGQSDPPLSDAGEEQCRMLGRRFGGQRLDALVSSDLERARLTAEAVGAATGTPVRLQPGLREIGLGLWEGIDRETLRRDYRELYERWVTDPSWDIVPQGEGGAPFRRRVLDTIASLVEARGDQETVAAVTHIGVIRTVLSFVTGLESRGLRWPWAVDNTGLTVLVGPPEVTGWATPALSITAINDSSHLRRTVAA